MPSRPPHPAMKSRGLAGELGEALAARLDGQRRGRDRIGRRGFDAVDGWDIAADEAQVFFSISFWVRCTMSIRRRQIFSMKVMTRSSSASRGQFGARCALRRAAAAGFGSSEFGKAFAHRDQFALQPGDFRFERGALVRHGHAGPAGAAFVAERDLSRCGYRAAAVAADLRLRMKRPFSDPEAAALRESGRGDGQEKSGEERDHADHAVLLRLQRSRADRRVVRCI